MRLVGVQGMPEVVRVALFLRYKGRDMPIMDPRMHLSPGQGFGASNSWSGASSTVDDAVGNPAMCMPQRSSALFEEVYAGQPMLELDDGLCIIGASAICVYIEETWPDPCLLGATALERANTEMWQREIETHVMSPLAVYCFHSAIDDEESGVAHVQNDEWGQRNLELTLRGIDEIDSRLSGSEFLAGGRFSSADLTLWSALEFARVFAIEIPAHCKSLLKWRERMAADINKELPDQSDFAIARAVPAVSVASGPSIHGGRPESSRLATGDETARVVIVDSEGLLRYANPSARSFHGIDPNEEITTKSIGDILGARYVERVVKPAVRQVIETGESRNGRGWVHYTRGHRKFVSSSFCPFDDDSAIIVVRDLYHLENIDVVSDDETSRTEREYDAERTRLIDAVLGSTTDRVSVVSRSGHYIYVNDALLEYFRVANREYQRESVIGKHMSQWFGEIGFESMWKPIIERCYEGENGKGSMNFTTPDGRLADVTYEFFPYRERTGVISGAIIQARDVGDELSAEFSHSNIAPGRQPDPARIRFTASILSATEGDRISVVDRDMRYIYINPEVLKAWRCPTDTFTNRHIEECIGPDQYALVKPHIERAFGGEYVYRRFRYQDPTMGSRVIAMEFYPFKDEHDPEPTAVIVKVQPLSEDFAQDNPEVVSLEFVRTSS